MPSLGSPPGYCFIPSPYGLRAIPCGLRTFFFLGTSERHFSCVLKTLKALVGGNTKCIRPPITPLQQKVFTSASENIVQQCDAPNNKDVLSRKLRLVFYIRLRKLVRETLLKLSKERRNDGARNMYRQAAVIRAVQYKKLRTLNCSCV